MRTSKFVCILATCVLSASLAYADEKSDCEANDGAFLIATVVKGPSFANGKPRKGIHLSHTHLVVKVDGDDASYDVAMDNVFAFDYVENSKKIPHSLMSIQVGDRLELCGELYDDSPGIHWVHTNCGATPTRDKPNGWVKVVDASGQPGANLEGSERYCRLWE